MHSPTKLEIFKSQQGKTANDTISIVALNSTKNSTLMSQIIAVKLSRNTPTKPHKIFPSSGAKGKPKLAKKIPQTTQVYIIT